MSYIPGNGFKKPLNTLENPIYPDIKQALPEFKWSGKHWRVDAGRTLIDTQDTPQFYDHAVLVQSRAYNSQNRYGVSSHKSVVNQNFRPPIIRREDILPLSRLPRETVVPRINPGTHDNYQTQNNRPGNIDKFVNGRLKSAGARPTFYKPMDQLQHPSFAYDELEKVVPVHSSSAGFVMPGSVGDYKGTYDPYKLVDKTSPSLDPGLAFSPNGTPSDFGVDITGTTNELVLDISGSSGFESPYDPGVQAPLNTTKTVDKLGVSASSGQSFQVTSQNYYVSPEGIVDLDRPISISSGFEMPSVAHAESALGGPPKRVRNKPKVAASAGKKTLYTPKSDPVEIELEKKNPSYSLTSGTTIPFRTITPEGMTPELTEKLRSGFTVRNAAPVSLGAGDISPGFQLSKVRMVDTLPVRSYEIPKMMPHTSKNDDGSHIHFKQKSDAFAYAPYENKGFIPRLGLDVQKVKLKKEILSK